MRGPRLRAPVGSAAAARRRERASPWGAPCAGAAPPARLPGLRALPGAAGGAGWGGRPGGSWRLPPAGLRLPPRLGSRSPRELGAGSFASFRLFFFFFFPTRGSAVLKFSLRQRLGKCRDSWTPDLDGAQGRSLFGGLGVCLQPSKLELSLLAPADLTGPGTGDRCRWEVGTRAEACAQLPWGSQTLVTWLVSCLGESVCRITVQWEN